MRREGNEIEIVECYHTGVKLAPTNERQGGTNYHMNFTLTSHDYDVTINKRDSGYCRFVQTYESILDAVVGYHRSEKRRVKSFQIHQIVIMPQANVICRRVDSSEPPHPMSSLSAHVVS